MKNKLLTGALLTKAIVSLAGPMDLSTSLLDRSQTEYNQNGQIVIETARQKIDFGNIPLSYAEVSTRKITDKLQTSSYRDLSFLLKDKDTEVSVYDYGADALSAGDFTQLKHKFNCGGSIEVLLKCRGAERYELGCTLNYPDGESATTKIDTEELNPFVRFLVHLRTKPMVEKGQRVYDGIVDSLGKNELIEIPYSDIKSTLAGLQSALPEIKKKDKRKQAYAALVKIYTTYNQIADKRGIK